MSKQPPRVTLRYSASGKTVQFGGNESEELFSMSPEKFAYTQRRIKRIVLGTRRSNRKPTRRK